jgi:hypothetical protein
MSRWWFRPETYYVGQLKERVASVLACWSHICITARTVGAKQQAFGGTANEPDDSSHSDQAFATRVGRWLILTRAEVNVSLSGRIGVERRDTRYPLGRITRKPGRK